MQKVMSLRLSKEDLDFLAREAKEEKTDKTSLARELIEKGRLMTAIEDYKNGKISIGKAAKKAGKTISEMIDLFAELGIKSNLTREHYLQGLKNLEKIWK